MRVRGDQFEALAQAGLTNQRRARLFSLRDQGLAVDQQSSGAVLVRDAAGHAAEFLDEGDAAVVVSGEGRRFRLENDRSGNLAAIEDPIGLRVQLDHDEEGRLLSVRRGEHSTFSYSYEDGHVSRAEAPDGTFSVYRHDELGRLVEVIDRNGNSRTFEYDEGGLLIGTAAPSGAETRFAYGELESPTSIELPGGDRYEFAYTSEGRLESMAVNGATHAAYDYQEDTGSREVRYADGSWARFRFDGERLVEAANETGVVKLAYDGSGHLVSEEFEGRTVEYSRDPTGALTGISLPDEEEIVFERDGEGRIEGVTDWNGDRYAITYHEVGAPAEIRYPNGLVQSMTASRMGLVEHLAVHRSSSLVDSVESCRWEYDACDRLVAEDRNDHKSSFSYDGEGRLTDVTSERPERCASYELDAEGNRIRDGSGEYQYDLGNRLLSGAGRAFSYDALGNLIHGTCPRGSATFAYNGRGQLVAVDLGSDLLVRYEHDALGRRVRKRVGDRVTHYVWAGAQLVSETSSEGGNTERRDFLYAGEHPAPLGMRVGADVFHLHPGRRGEPLCMTDRAGRVVWQAEYDALGNAQPSIREVDQPFRLLGQYFDDETGLHYNVARYYDPRLGRFLTQDPLRVSGGSLNFYLYADGDPLNKCDPTGELIPVLIGVGILAAIAIGAAVNGYREYKQQQDQYGEIAKPWQVVEEAGIGGAAGLVAVVAAIATVKVLAASAVVAVVGTATALETAFLAGVVSGVAGYCTDAGLSDRREASVEGVGWAAGIGGALGGAFQLLARPVSSLLGRIFKPSATPKPKPPKVTDSMGSETLDDAIRMTDQPFSPKPPKMSPQKQAGHVKGTPQYKNRIKAGKPTSAFDDAASAEQLTQEAWKKGTPVPGRPNVRDYDFGEPIGTGPNGGKVTKVRVHQDQKGRIHGHPKGQEQ